MASMRPVVVVIFVVLLAIATPLAHGATQTEIDALTDFYHSLNGPRWLQNSGWLRGDPCTSQWVGIGCTSSGNINEIDLRRNLLSGTLPRSIGNLTHLEEVYLGFNSIKNLPEEIGLWTNIHTLELNSNQIATTIPHSVGSLTNLQWLFLNDNKIVGSIPPSIGKATSLTWLYLFDNQLSGTIPDEIGFLTNIHTLSIGNCPNLSGSLPSSLGKLTKLTWTYFYNCSLTGTMPVGLGALQLKTLDLHNNNLQGELFFGGGWKQIDRLKLNNNQFSGSLPRAFASKPFGVLHLNNNKLSGNLPTNFSTKPSWVIGNNFDISNNQFTCPLPMWCSSLGNGKCSPCV